MTGERKILLGIIAILCVLCVVLGWLYYDQDDKAGIAERALNEVHEQNIETLNDSITTINEKVVHLIFENEKLSRKKARIHQQTIHIIDSVERLPFIEQASFFTGSIARIDSIRGRYFRHDHS
jgi:hypothetical protein